MLNTDRVLEIGVTALLVGMPWHEFVVALWKPLGAWDEVVLLMLAATLVVRRPRTWNWRLAAPMCALLLAGLLSVFIHGENPWVLRDWSEYMVGGIAASALPRERIPVVLRRLVAVAGFAAAYGLVTFIVFRAVGGGLYMRPDLGSTSLRLLLYPYYCGIYPRGGHLVGPFLNDVYFGLWLVAIFCVGCGVWRVAPRPVWLPIAMELILLAIPFTYSRTVYLALICAVVYFCIRVTVRYLVVILAVALLSIVYLTSVDTLRFTSWTLNGDSGRVAVARAGLHTLLHGPLLGQGLGSVSLADLQYAKFVVQFGWPGLLALLWLLVASLAPGFARHRSQPPSVRLEVAMGAAVGALLIGGFSSEILEVPQTAHTLWILVGLCWAQTSADVGPPEAGLASAELKPSSA